ncbi:MAG: DUF1570 domain-containing protein [Chthoniobacterales bacterium]|nr:DUF1570 domain-containing protein [Chthoniobacterales bacterium]
MTRLTALLALCLLTLHCASAPARAEESFTGGKWRVMRTGHYEVHTDLERALAEDLGKRLEVMHREYSTRLSDFQQSGKEEPVYQVYLFANKSDYHELTGNRFSNTGGVYMSHKKVLAAFLENQGRDALRRTLQHEAFHQFALTTINDELPVWLNEGMAEYFAEGIWTGNGFMVGQVAPRRIRQLQSDMSSKKLVPFRELLAMSLDEWNESLSGNSQRGAVHYNQTWAMVHFLVHGANGTEPYRKRLTHMLKLLHTGTPGDEAFRQAFSDNIEGFQTRFVEYANELKATPEATMIERQDVLADMLTALSTQNELQFDSFTRFRRAVTEGGFRLHYSKGSVDWKTESNPSVYFTDMAGRPLGPSALYFDNRAGGPLPDIVCRAGNLHLRTRFYKLGDTIDHEILTSD